ncbi:hypothetical protein [Streptomyces rubradiris]
MRAQKTYLVQDEVNTPDVGAGHPRKQAADATAERAINQLKHTRAVATHYDKRGYVFLGTAPAAALAIWLRT